MQLPVISTFHRCFMHRKYFFLFLLVLILSCSTSNDEGKSLKFDKTKWAIKQDPDYPYRDKMLSDFMTNYKLHDLKKDSLIHLLGLPDRTDNGYLFYRIAQQRLGILPLHTKHWL
jgi:hypothetical protein